jgi:hypothetical protein
MLLNFKFKSKHYVNHLSTKMISNGHNVNYKAIDLVEIYNFDAELTFI